MYPAHLAFTDQLRACLPQSDELTYEKLNKTVIDCSMKIFGKSPSSRPLPHWMDSDLRSLCLRKWEAFHRVRSLSTPTSVAGYFKCWLEVATLQRTTRNYKKQNKHARTSWVNKICSEAAHKADANNPRFFQYIRLLSPKKPVRTAGVRKMLSGTNSFEDEGKLLHSHYSDLFGAPSDHELLSWQCWDWSTSSSSCLPSMDVLAEYLAHLPMHKAVPSGNATGGAWRLALRLPQVRSCIHKLLVRLPRDGVEQAFQDGQLLLLPKPGKAGKHVDHFRPLVLQSHWERCCCIGSSTVWSWKFAIVFWLRLSLLT